MNNKRRAALRTALDAISRASIILDRVIDEESDSIDNIPENLQSTDKYDRMSEALDKLYLAADSLESASDGIESAIR